MSEHKLEKIASGVRCLVCEMEWKQKPRYGLCPGVKWYEYGTAPENLLTVGQLKKRKLKPGAPHVAVVGKASQWFLFDASQAIPFTAEEIAAQKEQERKARYRQCSSCKQEVRREKFDSEYGVCVSCLPALLENRRLAWEQERAEAEREHLAMLVKDRDHAIYWARDLLSRTDWVILDTETTGVDWTAEVISISVITPDGASLLETLVKPQEKIPAEASAVNHITDEMVENAQTFAEVCDKLCAALDGKLVIAYNADFDRRALLQSARRDGLSEERFSPNWQCAMLTYAEYVGEWNDYFGSYRWQKLPKGDHTAQGDCLATLALIRSMSETLTSEEEKNNPDG